MGKGFWGSVDDSIKSGADAVDSAVKDAVDTADEAIKDNMEQRDDILKGVVNPTHPSTAGDD